MADKEKLIVLIDEEYTNPEPGEWVKPVKKGYRMACCDCGLVHRMDFGYLKDSIGRVRIFFRAWRDEEETKKRRRKIGKK